MEYSPANKDIREDPADSDELNLKQKLGTIQEIFVQEFLFLYNLYTMNVGIFNKQIKKTHTNLLMLMNCKLEKNLCEQI